MKSRPKVGDTGELIIQTEAKHAVEFAGDAILDFCEQNPGAIIACRSNDIEVVIRHIFHHEIMLSSGGLSLLKASP